MYYFSLWKLYNYFCHSTNYKSNDSKGRQKCSLWKFVIHGKLKFFKKMGQMVVKPQIVVTIEVLMHIMSFINSLVRLIMMRKLFVTKKHPSSNRLHCGGQSECHSAAPLHIRGHSWNMSSQNQWFLTPSPLLTFLFSRVYLSNRLWG